MLHIAPPLQMWTYAMRHYEWLHYTSSGIHSLSTGQMRKAKPLFTLLPLREMRSSFTYVAMS